MKQTKLREPILYTSLWVVSVVLLVLLENYAPKSLDWFGYVLWMSIIILFLCIWIYALMWWMVCLAKRSDRHETKDMKKYILWKIKDIDENIEELQEEKEELLLSIKD
jgi:Na+-transporting methylmalonyl-CoA/oxaloacetate decarboxylase gamma subunit